MQCLLQIAIIATVSFLGELLNVLIPLPIPGSIYGLALMLIGLTTGLIKLDKVKPIADLFIALMPIMFIGPTVGLMSSYNSFKNIIVPIVVISIVTTIITMAATGLSSQWLIKIKKNKTKEDK